MGRAVRVLQDKHQRSEGRGVGERRGKVGEGKGDSRRGEERAGERDVCRYWEKMLTSENTHTHARTRTLSRVLTVCQTL